MAILGKPRSFYKGFLFTIEIPDVQWGGFMKCGEIKGTVAVIDHFEGGTLTSDSSPGRMSTADVELTRGATKDKDLYNWWLQVCNAADNTGAVDAEYKRTVDVVQRDRDGTELTRWVLYEAWPTSFTAGQWDNGADSNVIEAITLKYRYFASKEAA